VWAVGCCWAALFVDDVVALLEVAASTSPPRVWAVTGALDGGGGSRA
jgi:hypothetical protein